MNRIAEYDSIGDTMRLNPRKHLLYHWEILMPLLPYNRLKMESEGMVETNAI